MKEVKNKSERINIRVDRKLKNILFAVCSKNGISVSNFLTSMLIDGLVNKDLPPDLKKKLDNEKIRYEITETNAMYYLPKNMFRRVCDLALSQLMTTGKINRKLLNKVIDNYCKQYETFPSEIKKVLKDDFKITEAKLRNDDFVYEMTAKIKFLPKIK